MQLPGYYHEGYLGNSVPGVVGTELAANNGRDFEPTQAPIARFAAHGTPSYNSEITSSILAAATDQTDHDGDIFSLEPYDLEFMSSVVFGECKF
jgi:hypothetical protein